MEEILKKVIGVIYKNKLSADEKYSNGCLFHIIASEVSWRIDDETNMTYDEFIEASGNTPSKEYLLRTLRVILGNFVPYEDELEYIVYRFVNNMLKDWSDPFFVHADDVPVCITETAGGELKLVMFIDALHTGLDEEQLLMGFDLKCAMVYEYLKNIISG